LVDLFVWITVDRWLYKILGVVGVVCLGDYVEVYELLLLLDRVHWQFLGVGLKVGLRGNVLRLGVLCVLGVFGVLGVVVGVSNVLGIWG
jgi:hypothetical protein